MMSYEPSWLAEFLHSFPHLDLTFQPINSTFDPDSARYRESLVFWAAVPLLWLVLTLIIFLVYFCYRCCQRDVEKKRKVPCLKWSMAVLAVITMGVAGMGFYGNEIGHRGVKEFIKACEDGESMLDKVKAKVASLESIVASDVETGVASLLAVYNSRPNVERSLVLTFNQETNTALNLAQDILHEAVMIEQRTEHISMTDLPQLLSQYEFFRWLGMVVLLSWMVLLSLLLLIGIGLMSKCTLLMFCAVGIFTLVLSWLTAGLHLGVTVGIGDFCVDPNGFFEQLSYPRVEQDILEYYFECDDDSDNPFRNALYAATDKVAEANSSLTGALTEAYKFIERDALEDGAEQVYGGFSDMRDVLLDLSTSVQCSRLHNHYRHGLQGVCNVSLPGLSLLLLAAMLAGILFTLLVVLASRAWRHFGHKKAYMEVEDDDPFLPRPDNSSPSYYSFSRSGARAGRTADGNKSLGRRGSPPPAYNSNEFYRQYGDVNHPDDMNPEYMQVRESHA